MADLQPLLAAKITPALKALGPIQSLPAPAMVNLGGMSGKPLDALTPPAVPPEVVDNHRLNSNAVDPNQRRMGDLQADLYRRENPIAPTTTLGKIGHVAANIGNVLGDIFAPGAMSLSPGTQLYNERMMGRDKADMAQVSDLENQEAQRAQQAAQTKYTEHRPQIEQAKILQKLATSLAPKGIKATMNPDGTIDTQDDPDSQAYKNQQALQQLHSSQADKDDALTAIAQNKYAPGTPEYDREMTKIQLAEQTKQIALRTLGLRAEGLGLQANRLAFDQDKTYNPQPTAQERTKGDLASSALDRVQEMKQIVAKHPEYFGPVAGRATNAQAWLGSSDPDAVTYNNAAQYLADHSAGVFGGRGEYITRALHGLTDPKYTPEGLNAALDEAQRAAQGFAEAGKTHGKGQTGHAAAASSPNAPLGDTTKPDGVYEMNGQHYRVQGGKVYAH